MEGGAALDRAARRRRHPFRCIFLRIASGTIRLRPARVVRDGEALGLRSVAPLDRIGGASPTPQLPGDDPRVHVQVAEDVWAVTRSGSRAARGYRYQDDVAAWLCAQVVTGGVDADVLVPEGFEDVSCEGASAWQVQVKSRQDHRSDFTAAEAAQHVLAVAESDARRRAAGWAAGRS